MIKKRCEPIVSYVSMSIILVVLVFFVFMTYTVGFNNGVVAATNKTYIAEPTNEETILGRQRYNIVESNPKSLTSGGK